jgi:hypothetical protein
MRIRSNSILADLTEQQLNTLYEWIASGLTYRDVQQRCAQPPPEGFALQIHLNTLWRFFTAERRRRHAEELAQTQFHNVADAPDCEQLLRTIKLELAHACYDLASQPDSTSINALSRITHRLEILRLEQQRLALEREFLAEKKRQFNFNAAREAAKYSFKIKDTLKRADLDLEDKVWKVSEIVFGPKPDSENPAPPQ